jgi:hypothetical protein
VRSPVAIYYWLTPAFWAIDILFGANIRAAAFESHAGWKALYYLFCLGCGVALWLKPSWTRIVGLTEASFNILVLILGVTVPYFQLIDRLAAREAVIDPTPFGTEKALSLVLSGGIWAIAFRMQAGAFQPRARAKRRSA